MGVLDAVRLVLVAVTGVGPLLAAVVAGRCLRCHGQATSSDLPPGPIITLKVVKVQVTHLALYLANVKRGVARYIVSLTSL